MTDDPYTMALQLCDDDGTVRRGSMHHGTDYPCTGHAHYAGHHIRCTGPAHPPTDGLPPDLVRVLRDPTITVPQDALVPGWRVERAQASSKGDEK